MKIHLTTPDTPSGDVRLPPCPDDDLSEEELESLLCRHLSNTTKREYTMRDFFIQHFPSYCEGHPVPEEKLKVMSALMACKTGKLGYTLTECTGCGRIEMSACACGNRHCPSCGYLKEQQWAALRQSEIIPGIPYFHLTFTLPHELTWIMYQNQKETLNLLFRAAHETILVLSRDKLGFTPGIQTILHTFGSNLYLHYHLHVLVSGGGLTAGKSAFKRCLSNEFFLPEKALKRVYKGKFMDGLKQLRADGKLLYAGECRKYRNSYEWKELLDTCYGKEWNINIKYLAPVPETGAQDSGAETAKNAAAYFSRYTNRTAISDNRIIGYDTDEIRFRYKVYGHDSYTVQTLSLKPQEFIRRFLMHILPSGLMRIRSAGFLSGCVKQKNLRLIHMLLEMEYEESPIKTMSSAELLKHFFGRDIKVCQNCHSGVAIYHRMHRKSAANLIRAA